jgi:low molecular weight protein-tyrosine phosphatase
VSSAPLVVLHVCTGNICRSPMAELLMRAELDRHYAAADRVVLDGAGTYGGHAGQPINPPAAVALRGFGIDASEFRAQHLSKRALQAAGLVLCATHEHVQRVVTVMPEAAGRTFTLLDLAEVAVRQAPGPSPAAGGADPAERLLTLCDLARTRRRSPSDDGDIADPYGLSQPVYDATARQIHRAVQAIVGVPGVAAE